MLSFRDIRKMSVQFDSSKDRKYDVDDQRNNTYYIRKNPPWITFKMIDLGNCKEKYTEVGEEKYITCIMPSESQ